MPIFAIQPGRKLKKLNTSVFSREKDLQRLVEQNLLEVLDMHLIESEYRTDSGQIDSLAVDRDGAPVILEFKKSRDDNVINQALSYFKWLRSQRREFFEMLMLNRLGDAADGIQLDWYGPRIVCVAESFSQHDLDTVEVIPIKIDLFKYRLIDQNLLSLEMVTVRKPSIGQASPVPAISAESVLAIINAMKDQSGASEVVRQMFDEIRGRILQLDEHIIEKPGRNNTIAYKLAKNFCVIQIKRDGLVISLRPVEFQDPACMVERIAERYVLTLNRRITIASLGELDYVCGIIGQSYQDVV